MRQKREIPKKANSFGTFLQIAQSIQPVNAAQETGLIAEFLEEALDTSPSDEAEEEEASPSSTSAKPKVVAPDAQTTTLLRIVAQHETITVPDLMREAPMNFMEFAQHMNNLTKIGMLELVPAPEDPQIEQVRLSSLGRQALKDIRI